MEGISWFLIAAAVVMVALTVIGAIRGFVHTIFVTFGLIIIIVLTMIFNPYIKSFITENTDVAQRVKRKVAEKLDLENKYSENLASEWDVGTFLGKIELPDKIKSSIREATSASSMAIKDIKAKNEAETRKERSKKAIDLIYDSLTDLIMGAIAYLVTFAVASLIVLVLYLLLGLASKLPVLRTMNGLLGGICGFIQGYLVLSLIYVIAVAFGSTDFGMSILEQIKGNSILTWFYGHNIVVDLLMSMFKG